MTKIEIKLITEIEAFKKLEDQWNQLLSVSPIKSAFLTWTWVYSWWATYGQTRDLWIVTAWVDQTLVCIAPLMHEKRKKGVANLKFLVNLGTPQSDAGGFLFDPKNRGGIDEVVNFIFSQKSEWNIIELNVLFSTGQEREALIQLCNPADFFLKEEKNEHYFIPLADEWNAFSSRLSKKFMHNLRRAEKLALTLGEVKIQHYSGELVSEKLVDKLVDINRHSHFPRLYNSQQEQTLLRELIRNGGEQSNWLDIYILEINGEAIAYEYGFVYEKQFESWRSGFDTNAPKSISVGKLLSMKVIQTCIQEGYLEIDLLRGNEAYKREWKPEVKIYSNIRIFNRKKLQSVLSYRWLHNIKPFFQKIRQSKME